MVLLTAIGLRKTFRLITQYPGILFVPMFSLWTIGPISKSETKSCCQLFKQEKLGISAKFTWINFILSMVCSVVTSLLLVFDLDSRAEDYVTIWIILAPMIIILLITMVSLLHGDSLNNFWCCCFKWQYYWFDCCKNCVVTKYSVLNLATMEEDSEMQEILNQTPNFEEQETGSHSRKHCINFSQCCMISLIILLVTAVFVICLLFVNVLIPVFVGTSFFVLTFSVAKYLKTGPCRLVPNEGRLGGFFERGFICLLVNIGFTILIKVVFPAIGIFFGHGIKPYWMILLNTLPQFIYVSSLLRIIVLSKGQ